MTITTFTLNADTIDQISPELLAGTPMTMDDIALFKDACRFSKIPHSFWEEVVRVEQGQEKYEVLVENYRQGVVRLCVKIIDRTQGKFFGETRAYKVQDTLNNPEEATPISSNEFFSIAYPFTPDYLASRIRFYSNLFWRYGEDSDDMRKTKSQIINDVIPCVRGLSLEQRKQIMEDAHNTTINECVEDFYKALFSQEELDTELANW